MVTKWMPLFRVQEMVVGSAGTGTSRPLKPTTAANQISHYRKTCFGIHTLDEDLAVRLAILLLFAELPKLLGVFVLRYSLSLTDTTFSCSEHSPYQTVS